MTDTREQVERLTEFDRLWLHVYEGWDLPNMVDLQDEVDSLLSRLEAAEAERDAAVAGAYEAAAQIVRRAGHSLDAEIRSLTPADAQTDLDLVKAEEREACATFLREYADNFPVGSKNQQLGSSSYNWFRRAAKVLSARNATIREGK